MGTILTEADFADTQAVSSPKRIFSEEDFLPSQAQDLQAEKTSYGGNLLRSALSGVTGGLSDEIGAYGAAGLDRLFGTATDFNQRKDEYLNLARGAEKRFAKENPITDMASKIVGGVAMPLGTVGKGMSLVPRMALQGGTAGALTGFGTSEGGFENRFKDATKGGLIGLGTGAVLGGIGEGMKKIAPALVAESKALQRKSLGARQSDYAKTAGSLKQFNVPEAADVETLTKKSLDDLIESGVFGKTRDPVKLQKIANHESKNLAGQIGKLIQDNDDTAPVAFERAKSLLTSGEIPGDEVSKYARRLGKLEEEIGAQGSKLSYLQKQKIAFGSKWSPDDSTANVFNRAIYGDLQKTIESVIPEVADVNKELQKWQIFNNISARNIAGEEAKDATQKLIQTIRTTGGFGVPILAGSYAGGPIGMAGGVLAAGLGKAATSPGGQRVLGELAEKLSKGAANVEQALPKVLAPIASQATRANLSQNYSKPQQDIPQKKSQMRDASSPKLSGQKVEKTSRSSSDFTADLPSLPETIGKREVSSVINKLDPLIQAVIHTESGGNPNARSSAGARGLMQVMPEHYKRLGVTDPEDPLQSIKAGTTILQEEMDRFDDPKLALAAYNAGSPKVIRAIAKAGSHDFNRVYPYLPEETKKYVAKVLKKYQQIKV